MKIRKIASLTALLSFVVVIVTSIVLYIVPQGRIAYWADWRADKGRSVIASPTVYALSLAVYCTAWTFFGSVGRSATAGLSFLHADFSYRAFFFDDDPRIVDFDRTVEWFGGHDRVVVAVASRDGRSASDNGRASVIARSEHSGLESPRGR
mgnify:CR=1 FL=1